MVRAPYAVLSMRVKLRVQVVYMTLTRRMLEKARPGTMSKGG